MTEIQILRAKNYLGRAAKKVPHSILGKLRYQPHCMECMPGILKCSPTFPLSLTIISFHRFPSIFVYINEALPQASRTAGPEWAHLTLLLFGMGLLG